MLSVYIVYRLDITFKISYKIVALFTENYPSLSIALDCKAYLVANDKKIYNYPAALKGKQNIKKKERTEKDLRKE